MIHKTAIVDSKANISSNVKIGPYSVIGPNVEINSGSEVQSHVKILLLLDKLGLLEAL